MKKNLDERLEEDVLRWYDHIVRMDDVGVVKNVCKSESLGNRLGGKLRCK